MVEITGLDAIALADICGVGPSVMSRWILGHATPMPHTRQAIVDDIKRYSEVRNLMSKRDAT